MSRALDSVRTGMSVADFIDRSSDVVVAAIAAWTLAYQASLIAHLSRGTVLGSFALILATILFLGRGSDTDRSVRFATDGRSRTATWVALPLAMAAAAAAVAAMTEADTIFWVLSVATIVSAIAWAIRRHDATEPPSRGVGLAEIGVVVVVAIGFAMLSSFIRSPNGDDTYYLNRALYIEAHPGPFPTNDTLYGDQLYPSVARPDTLASYEAFVGTAAAMTGVDVRTMYYLVLAPIFGLLGIFALWRLTRTAEARAPALAVVAAVAFLLATAKGGRGVAGEWGDYALLRAYQGKSILIVFALPWLWHHATRFVRSGSRRSFVSMLVGTVAAVGFSSSGALIAPLVMMAASAPLVFRSRTDNLRSQLGRLAGATAAIAYAALGIAAVTLPLATETSATRSERAIAGPVDAWARALGSGVELFACVMVVLIGWIVVREPHLRLGLAFATLGVVVAFSPIGIDVLHRLGLGLTGWRILWVLPLPVMFGLVADHPLAWRGAGGKIVAALMIPVSIALLSIDTRRQPSLLEREYGAPSWDLDPEHRRAAERLTALAGPGGTVAAPGPVSRLVGAVSLTAHPVDVREGYTRRLGRQVGPSFHAGERETLTTVLTGQPASRRAVEDALDVLDIDTVCASKSVEEALDDVLRRAGFRRAGVDAICTFWTR